MPKLGPGVLVTGLTLGALAVVGLLTAQASGTERRVAAAHPLPTTSSGPSAGASPSATPSPTAAPSPALAPLPATAGSSSVRRVVYALGARQVWLVDPHKDPQVQAAFTVQPGSVDPATGNYTVYSRSATTNGTDGRPVEHVVRFTQQGGTVFGFSAAVDGSTPAADPRIHTGGIRATRQDGQTLWDFAPTGTRVTVVP